MKIITQLIGLVAIALVFFLYQQGDRKKMLFTKMSSEILWAVHYYLLASYSAVFTMLIGIIREIVFMQKEKLKHKTLVLCAFLLMYIVAAIITYKNIYSIVPSVCSIIMTLSFWVNNVKYIKLGTLPASVLMIIYNITCSSYAGIFNEIVVLSSLAIWFIRSCKQADKKAKSKPEKITN